MAGKVISLFFAPIRVRTVPTFVAVRNSGTPKAFENVNLGNFLGGNFNQMRRGVKMGIRKYSKTFKNIQKHSKTGWKYSKTNTKYSKIFKNFAGTCAFD